MMNRREFIVSLGVGSLLSSNLLLSCRDKKQAYVVKEINGNSKIGHLLREEFKKPGTSKKQETDILIIGGGIAGLSAARKLQQSSSLKTILIELSNQCGGNSMGGKNETSAYPWAAHYLPIPSLEMTELIEFLKEAKIISSFEDNLPVYTEDYICYDNKERLFINGKWQEGIIPHFNLAQHEVVEIQSFMNLVHGLRDKKDQQGKYYFDIPLHKSSQENEWIQTNSISAYDWLIQHNYKSEALHWYINYCTSDDFGSHYKNTSAWAMFHYFASRRGKAANASYDDILTWPEGNQFLANKLIESVTIPIQVNQIALHVEKLDDGYNVYHQHTETQEWTITHCKHLVLNTPFHVANKLLPFLEIEKHKHSFHSYPWLIANITVKKMDEKNGLPLSWDNVIFKKNSLGFIHSNHQTLSREITNHVFTYYKNLNILSPSEERTLLYNKSIDQLKNEIIDELKIIYPDIESYIQSIEIKKIGHGMISPSPNFLFSSTLNFFEKPNEKIYFTHTDYCGMSIFEEAFYKGLETAEQILTHETN